MNSIHPRTQPTPPVSQRRGVRLGAPKGIRILIVLVTIGARWDSLVQRSCGEYQ